MSYDTLISIALSLGWDVWKWPVYLLVLPVFVMWGIYGHVMNLKRAWAAGTLTMPAKALGLIYLVIGGLLDFYCNVVPFTIISGFRPPMELTVSKRLQKYRHMTGWPKRVSDFFGRHFLNPLDPSGDHLD